MTDVAKVLLSVGLGALAGAFGTAWKSHKDLETQYDISLRERRIVAYTALWKELQPLAYHFGSRPTFAAIDDLGAALRDWYFTTGGLVLSASTRPIYFNLQQALTGVAAGSRPDGPIGEDEYLVVKALASRLRTATTEDVATRVGPRHGPAVRAALRRSLHRWSPAHAELHVTVDRRWKWTDGVADPAVFAIVTNLTDRELEITRVALPGGPVLVDEDEATCFWLQPGEEREVGGAVAPAGERPIAPRIRPTVGRRRRGADTPSVPLPSGLVTVGAAASDEPD